MSTFEPHPIAERPVLDLFATTCSGNPLLGRTELTRILEHGNLVATLLTDRHTSRSHRLVIWDWLTGTELMQIDLGSMPPQESPNLTFLSQDYCIVHDLPKPVLGIDNTLVYRQLGELKVYRIPRSDSSPLPLFNPLVAKLMLPDLQVDQSGLVLLFLNYLPALKAISPAEPLKLPPKIYEPGRNSRLLQIDIYCSKDMEPAHCPLGQPRVVRYDRGMLFLDAELVADTIDRHVKDPPGMAGDSNHEISIPWESWSSCTRYISWRRSHEYYTYGLQCLVTRRDLSASPNALHFTILDFKPRSRQEPDHGEQSGEVGTDSDIEQAEEDSWIDKGESVLAHSFAETARIGLQVTRKDGVIPSLPVTGQVDDDDTYMFSSDGENLIVEVCETVYGEAKAPSGYYVYKL